VENINLLENLVCRYPQLESLKEEIQKAADCLIKCYANGGKVLVCGNGGSCSDSNHIVGELMKGFEHKRPIEEPLKKQLSYIGEERGKYLAEKLQQGLPAISLTSHSALITAVSNDMDADLIFAQQVTGYGNAGDVLIAISTSGDSQNVVDAVITAKAKGLLIIALTGKSGGKIKMFCDILLNVPEINTAFVQELHLPVYHTLCRLVENNFFGN
jgi:D-sedoheptulose 7-phosphate isomerase